MSDESRQGGASGSSDSNEPGDAAELFALVYDDLKRAARAQLRKLRPGQTLDTTALVHETYFKFAGQKEPVWESRGHFYAVTARAMRQVLVDAARRAHREKRGGGVRPLELEEQLVPGSTDLQRIVEIDEALDKLAVYGPRLAQVVEYRFFAGLSEQEVAELLGVTDRTVRNDWARARAWLKEAMRL